MKKFELTAEVKEFFGIKLFRVKALVAFGNVHVGELGGWVEKESNLAQDGDARASGDDDWITISPIGSENGALTAFRQKDESIIVRRGCFSGTIEEFEAAVNNHHGDNRSGEIYRHVISLLKLRFTLS
ncbi:hypothetical protein [Symbiopectobacterium sp.]|uniref:hypothetical protein n=1 Tax=Symbiopectobacterium sp. TaxID=2952789 RepID=UPI003F34FC14